MKVMMVVEGSGCALRIEPQDEEGLALLAAFGVNGTYQAKLGQVTESPLPAGELLGCGHAGATAELD